MSISKRVRVVSLLAMALALGAIVLGWGHSTAGTSLAGGTDGAMAVDCDASQGGIQSDCQHDPGSTFNVEVHITQANAAGYSGFQVKLDWGGQGVVNYLPTVNSADEALWPDCTIPARQNNKENTGEPSVFFGCFPLTVSAHFDTGAVLTFEFQCKDPAVGVSPPPGLDPDQTLLTLVPQAGDPQGGTHVIDADLQAHDPALTGATVTCRAGGAQPTPTPTPGGPPATPGPEGGVSLTSGDTSIAVGETSVLTFTVTDNAGNPVEGVDCTFSIVGPEGSDATVSPLTDTSDADGAVSTTFTAGTEPETVQVKVDCGDFGAQVLDVEVSPTGPPSVGSGAFGDDGVSGRIWLLLGLLLAATAAGLTVFGWRYARTR